MKITRADVLSPANGVTLLGLALTLHGSLNLNELNGVIEVGVGRLLDVLDGPVARATRASRFGAAIDAVSDKLAMFAILTASLLYGSSPLIFIGYVFLQNIANAVIGLYAHHRKIELEASLYGKRTMFLQSFALAGFALAGVSSGALSTTAEVVAVAAAVVSVLFGLLATKGYAASAGIR